MIGIITDSATNTPAEYLEFERLENVTLRVFMGEESYEDNELPEEKLFAYMENNFPKTSLPKFPDIEAAFERLVEKGCDEIISINISSGLSGTYNIFTNVAKDIEKKHDVKIKTIDTKNISIGAGLIVVKAVEMIKEGKSFDEIVEEISKVEKSKVLFSIPTLKFLKAGGRIGKVSGTIGEILNIKPVITCNFEGIYETVSKSRGMKKAMKSMFDRAMEFVNGDEIHSLAVYHSGDEPETLKLVETLKNNLADLMDKSLHFFEGKISPTMIVHTGNGLIGMAVIKK
ncbi:DegV family protein [Geotoga petraea]|uniref:DegV family protein n=1 Tax=Geotoga petraea TaxID=28234 RepID=A0A4Z0VYR0_9BACT|nr:DegV family protein [Geotoga petraea]TGG86901.1 DegV family protein [Geotoga petraea]